MSRITLALLVTVALLFAACGGGSQTTGVTTPTLAGPTPTRAAVAPSGYCQQSREPLPAWNVQVTARWEGKDRIVIEGSADLPSPGSVTYLVCQDGEVSSSLLWAEQPTIEDGKIRGMSKLVDSQSGPAFDPDASFVVVLTVVGAPIQMPYFTVQIPVEGKPG
jgi:hypothetical protein